MILILCMEILKHFWFLKYFDKIVIIFVVIYFHGCNFVSFKNRQWFILNNLYPFFSKWRFNNTFTPPTANSLVVAVFGRPGRASSKKLVWQQLNSAAQVFTVENERAALPYVHSLARFWFRWRFSFEILAFVHC